MRTRRDRAEGTSTDSPWGDFAARRLSRRSLLRASGRAGVGAAGLALVGCGGDDDPAAVDVPPITPTESGPDAAPLPVDVAPVGQPPTSPTATDERERVEDGMETGPPPQRGGVLRTASPLQSHDLFDPHRSNSLPTASWMAHFMSRLVRWRNQEQSDLEGDLADLPEMPDEETYIFRIRESARFWDRISGRGEAGRAVTAEDIRFNVRRQVEAVDGQGEPDSRFVSADKYRRTASVEVVADRTLVLKTDGPSASYLGGVHAGPFSWITSPEAVEAFGDRWRSEPNAVELVAGSGFMVPATFDPATALVLQRNDGFGRTSGGRPLPYLDGREFRNLSTVNAVQTAYLERRIDEAEFPLRRSDIDALRETYPDHDVSERPFGFTVDAWFNFNANWPGEDGNGNPWVDRRVAFAFHLAIDRARLADLIYSGDAQLSANALTPWFTGPWAPAEDELAGWPGFRSDRDADIAEARALLDAAAMDDETSFVFFVPENWEQANPGVRDVMRMMYEQTTQRAVRLRVEPSGVIARRLAEGTLPGKAPSWTTPPEGVDPTLAFAESLLPNAARNFLHYDYPPVTDLVERMQVTLDVGERQELAQRVTRILLGIDAAHGVNGFGAAVGVMNGIQRTIRRPYVHVDADTMQFGAADHNHERSWIDIDHPDYAG